MLTESCAYSPLPNNVDQLDLRYHPRASPVSAQEWGCSKKCTREQQGQGCYTRKDELRSEGDHSTIPEIGDGDSNVWPCTGLNWSSMPWMGCGWQQRSRTDLVGPQGPWQMSLVLHEVFSGISPRIAAIWQQHLQIRTIRRICNWKWSPPTQLILPNSGWRTCMSTAGPAHGVVHICVLSQDQFRGDTQC